MSLTNVLLAPDVSPNEQDNHLQLLLIRLSRSNLSKYIARYGACDMAGEGGEAGEAGETGSTGVTVVDSLQHLIFCVTMLGNKTYFNMKIIEIYKSYKTLSH